MVVIEQLEQELRGIGALIEDAAVDEDFVEWSMLAMRRDALPALLRQVRARPVRREIEQVKGELESLEQERQRILEEEQAVGRHGINDATSDPLELARTFASCLGCNVGLATGVRSRVAALDNDSLDGAASSLKALAGFFGVPGLT